MPIVRWAVAQRQ